MVYKMVYEMVYDMVNKIVYNIIKKVYKQNSVVILISVLPISLYIDSSGDKYAHYQLSIQRNISPRLLGNSEAFALEILELDRSVVLVYKGLTIV